MSIDLNQLPNEAPTVADVDWDNYADPSEFPPAIPEGTYNFKTTKLEVEKFEAGVVSFIADHELYDTATGEKVGNINFDRFTTKVFTRMNVPASMAADMLRAAGITDRPTSPREWGALILSIKSLADSGQVWQGVVQWDGYCAHKNTAFETVMGADKKPLPAQPSGHVLPWAKKGMKNWPQEGVNGAAHHVDTMPCPTCGELIRARAKISRRIPRS